MQGGWTLLGLVLMSGASSALVYGLSELGTPNTSLGAPQVVGPIVAGVVLAGVFCWHALRVEHPLLDVRLYANRVFGAASLTTFGLGAALFGAMILVPLYYQEVRHESVIVTGLLTGPQGLGMLLVMPLAGRLSDRFGGGRVALAGVSVLSLSTLPLAFIGAHTSIVYLSLVLVLRGVGIGFSFMPAMTAAFASLRSDQLSDATPQLNVLQRIGGAIGTAVLAVVLQRATEHAHTVSALAGAYGTAFWWSVGICVVSLIPCLVLLRAENPRARMSRRRPTPRRPRSRWACSGATIMAAPPPAEPKVEPSAELTELGVAFRRVFRSFNRLRGRDTHLGANELSHAQFELLIELSERGELPAGELAAAARLTPATVTQMLDHLAEQGHVERVPLGDRPARGRLPAHASGKAQDRRQAQGLAESLGTGAAGRGCRRAARGHACARTPAAMVEDTPAEPACESPLPAVGLAFEPAPDRCSEQESLCYSRKRVAWTQSTLLRSTDTATKMVTSSR